jgi:hypothetical protein
MDVLVTLRRAVEALQPYRYQPGAEGQSAVHAQSELKKLTQKIQLLIDTEFCDESSVASVDSIDGRSSRFEVRRGSLVRIGYSKRFGRTYERAIAAHVLSRTLEALQTLRQQGDGPLPPERIILQVVGRWGESIQGSQVYAAMGMLLEANVLTQSSDGSIRLPRNVMDVARSVLGLAG